MLLDFISSSPKLKQQSGLKTRRVLSYSAEKLMLVHMYVCVISEQGMFSRIDMLV